MHTLENIKNFLGRDWLDIQEGIKNHLATEIELLDGVNRRLISQPGKQIRPLLSILVARCCNEGKSSRSSIECAVASELLHNATLLHDDVADEAEVRRGQPTVRSLMGANSSVLIGDFWLVRAVQAVLDSECGIKTISIFSKTLSDLAEGEMLQLQKAEKGDTIMEDYLNIIYRKTASLFVATAVSAAISVNAPRQLEEAAADFGKNLGLAFQMRDDIFDYMPSANIGKAIGVDILERKITLPLLCALDRTDAGRQKEIRAMVCSIDVAKRDEILDFVRVYDGLEAAQKVLDSYCEKAMEALGAFPACEEREILGSLVSIVSKRTI